MAYDGAGNYNRVHDWTQDRDAGYNINAARMDEEFDDIAAALSAALLRDGRAAMTNALNMGGFAITNMDAPATRTNLDVPGLSVENEFTANQLLRGSVEREFTLHRDTTTAFAGLGLLRFSGDDSGGGENAYAAIQGLLIDPTAASEDGGLLLQTAQGGTVANRVQVRNGMFMQGALGGDKGAGSFNAQSLFVNGAQLYYEEGTFTPIIVGTTAAGAGTYDNQVGTYTRIGNRVFFDLWVKWTAHTGTGQMEVAGLPYSPSGGSTADYSGVGVSSWNISLGAGYTQLMAFVHNNQDRIVMRQANDTTSTTLAMDTSGYLIMGGHYNIG